MGFQMVTVTRAAVLIGLLGVAASASAQSTPATHGRAHKATRTAKPAPQPVPDAPRTLPMDFSGMSRSVGDLNTPSNARSNNQFNGDTGTSRGGLSPGATFKF